MLSAAEAELGALYIIAKKCVYIRLMLEEMGHQQPVTPLQIDNTTAEGVILLTSQAVFNRAKAQLK